MAIKRDGEVKQKAPRRSRNEIAQQGSARKKRAVDRAERKAIASLKDTVAVIDTAIVGEEELAREAFIVECVRLKQKGWSYSRIREEMAARVPPILRGLKEFDNLTITWVTKQIERYLRLAEINVDAMRHLNYQRLEELYASVYEEAVNKNNLKAVGVAAILLKQQSELYGMSIKPMDEMTAIEVLVKAGVLDPKLISVMSAKIVSFKKDVTDLLALNQLKSAEVLE